MVEKQKREAYWLFPYKTANTENLNYINKTRLLRDP